jgi:hypothetical protein
MQFAGLVRLHETALELLENAVVVFYDLLELVLDVMVN